MASKKPQMPPFVWFSDEPICVPLLRTVAVVENWDSFLSSSLKSDAFKIAGISSFPFFKNCYMLAEKPYPLRDGTSRAARSRGKL